MTDLHITEATYFLMVHFPETNVVLVTVIIHNNAL